MLFDDGKIIINELKTTNFRDAHFKEKSSL